MVVGALVTVAFGNNGGSARDGGVAVYWIFGDDVTPPMPPMTGTPAATRTPVTPSGAEVSGFIFPIEGACLPEDDNLIPGALREYRNAIHEGLDFYDADNCTFIGIDTEVLAAKDGTVIRADHDYQPLTPETLQELDERVAGGDTSPDIEDSYRGRQVWLQHADGTVTRYAHLNGVADAAIVGAQVEAGDVIGYVGDSGTPESVTDPLTQVHLHFEIRIGGGYLGQGLEPDEVRRLYEQAFSP